MRFNETENSEFNASRVLDYRKDVFHDMMITLGVRDQKGFHIDKLNEALVAHDIHAEPRSYRISLSGNKFLYTNSVRFGFYGSVRSPKYESIAPNASSICLYSFLYARDGPPDRLGADIGDGSGSLGMEANRSTLDSDDESDTDMNTDDSQSGDLCGPCTLKLLDKGVFKCKAMNNKSAMFWKLPSSTALKHVKAKMTDEDMAEVAKHLGRGDANLGISHLTQRLYQYDSQSVVKGLQEQNCHFRTGRLSTEKSMMFLSAMNISMEQYKTMSALLKYHLGYDVLATHASMQKYQNPYATKEAWHDFPGVRGKDGTVGSGAHKYWVKNALEVLKNRLRSDRDHHLPCAEGITCVNRENPNQVVKRDYISVVIACDGGGGSFKATATIALRHSDRNLFLEHVAWAGCKEEYDLLSTGILEKLGDDLWELRGKTLLFASIPGSNTWDFMCLPAEITACDATSLFYDEEMEKVCYRYQYPMNSGEYAVEPFEKLTKNDFERGLVTKILPVEMSMVGDLRFMSLTQNRTNFAGMRCTFCQSHAADYASSYAASKATKMFTSADFDHWRSDPTAKTMCDYHYAGFKSGENVLLSGIPLEKRSIPRLHEEIGLVTAFYKAIQTFAIDNVENDSANKRGYYHSRLQECSAIVSESLEQYNAISSAPGYKEDFKVYTAHLAYLQEYKDKGSSLDRSQFPLFLRGVTSEQRKQIANVENAELLRNEHNIHLDEYKVLLEKFKRCGGKAGNDERKKSKLLTAVDAVFSKYHIEPQAYHGGSLVGNHSKQLLDHSSDILSSIEKLFLEEIDAQFPPPAMLVQEESRDTRRRKAPPVAPARAESLAEGAALRERIASSKREEVRNFCQKMSILASALDVLFSALSCFEPLEEEDIQELERLAKLVGDLWRELELGARKPKLHILEAHACDFIRAHQPLGFVTEEGVEKLHAARNRIYRLFCSVKDEWRKEVYTLNRENQQAGVKPQVNVFETARKKRKPAMAIDGSARKTAPILRQERKEVKRESLLAYEQQMANSTSSSMEVHGSD
jgi:hypothetical protein